MGKIVFMCDMEEGHLLPTFGMAHSLKKRGHEVIYLSVADNEDFIKDQGFRFYAALQGLYPKGLRKMQKKHALNANAVQMLEHGTYHNYHVQQVMRGAYDAFINEVKADLYVVSFYMPFEIFVLYYKYNITPVIFSPVIQGPEKPIDLHALAYLHGLGLDEKSMIVDLLSERNIGFRSFKDVLKPLLNFKQLIFCPGEFQIGTPVGTSNMHFIEPSIREKTSSVDIFALYGIPSTKKIIYASMGSQALRHGISCAFFFNKIIQVMKNESFSNLHLILAVDAQFNTSTLLPVPNNVTITNWAPQIDILKVASVAIIHGGLGSVKECIYFGVPMIVFPQGYDQPANAQRVVHHNMGFADDIHTVSESNLQYYITQALSQQKIMDGIQAMRQIFHVKEEKQEGSHILEAMLQKEAWQPLGL